MTLKKKTLGQAALEYLVTYGWALVMIATIIGVLVFAAGGGISLNTCTTFLTMVCKGIGAEGDTLVLVLQNSSGQKISINPFFDIKFDGRAGYAIVTYKGNDYRFDDISIEAGDEFTISARGMAGAEEISITYVEESTGLTKTITSSLGTDAPEDLELSNDAIDNDGVNGVDCADPALTDCEYVVEATLFTGDRTVTTAWEEFEFYAVEGADGEALEGGWQAKDTVIFAFYVENLTLGTTADVRFGTYTALNVNLNEGWNFVEITIPPLAYVPLLPLPGPEANVPEFYIKSNENNFTIVDDPLPKAVLVLNQ